MPKKPKRPTGLLPCTFPKLPPYKTVDDFIYSKKILDSIQIPNYQWDKPGHDPIFHLLAAQRILQFNEDELIEKRKWAKEEFKNLGEQWRTLYELEAKLKDSFKKLSSFVKSNQEKRERAKNKVLEDRELVEERTEHLAELQEKYDYITGLKKEMDEQISYLQVYEKFLNGAATESDEFINAQHFIDRYEALVDTRTALGKRQTQNLSDLEHFKVKFAKTIEENRFKILGLNNEVAQLNSKYNAIAKQALHWESVVLAVRRHSYLKYQGINEVKHACWNMYLLMSRRKGEVPKLNEYDFENQLIYVKKTLRELQTVQSMATSGDKNGSAMKLREVKKKKSRTHRHSDA